MTCDEFNVKYQSYLEKGFDGLELENPEVIEYLDKMFSEFIKVPNFKYSQIKMKYDECRFYAEPVNSELQHEIETHIANLYKHPERA
jgi:hypothetical protein